MKIVFCWLIMLTATFQLNAQTQTVIYDENAEVRQVGNFTGIEVSGTISLYLSQGATTGVAISAGEEKYNEKIKTEVVNGVLKISVDGGMWNTFSLANKKLKAYVSVSDINRFDVSGASYATINGVLKSPILQMNISGASEVKGIVEVDKLNLDISGASVARLAGNAGEGLLEASGACKILSYELNFQKLKANATGASQIRTTITKELVADASGGSTIYYKGDGTVGRTNATGGASIQKRSGGND